MRSVARTWAALQRVRRLSTAPISHNAGELDSATCRARIAAFNGEVNAMVRVSPPPVSPSTSGEPGKAGLLEECPVAVKDTICTVDMGTGCASNMLKDFNPPYDATVVRLLRAAGADIIGKTNCDEFGMGSLNVHTIHGPVHNPYGSSAYYDPSASASTSRVPIEPTAPRSAGGSSGGSAAAVASGMCYAALGTDTGGSTRLPAAYCGVVGLKPSYGLLSRWGVVSFADSLDCVGVLARTVDGVKRVFDMINIHDPKDPTSASREARASAWMACQTRLDDVKMGAQPGRLDGVRVGIPQEYFPSELASSITNTLRRTIAHLRSRGAIPVPVSLPATSYALSAYYVLASAEASSCLARFDGVQYGLNVRPGPEKDLSMMTPGEIYALSRTAGFGREVRKRVLLGTYALSADAFDNYFLQAQRVRELVKRDFERVFVVGDYRSGEALGESSGVDVLLHPSAIRTAPLLSSSGVETYVQDVLTVPASLAGLPGMSVPVGGEVGVSVVGQWGCEEMVFLVGRVVEGVSSVP